MLYVVSKSETEMIQTEKYCYKWINKLFSEENKVPRDLFEAIQVAGSAKYKQRCSYLSSVCLLSPFSPENKDSLFT